MDSAKKPLVVLMADDDEDDRLLVWEAFEGRPVELRFVEDGEELMDYLYCRGKYRTGDDPRPDLILLDLNMPRKDGRDALKEIRADTQLKTIPVVVLTTSQEESEINRSYALGANTFIVKPVTFDHLSQILHSLQAYWINASRLPTKELPQGCRGDSDTSAES
jgi:CheY-like chemotaxis protein